MANLVIVALPSEDDYVTRISSEKKPHMTLLYLGDVGQVTNLEKITEFVEYAASTLVRFNLSVARRGPLGVDSADVLFFDRYYRWDYKLIADFRDQLLQENNIKTAYDSVAQQDEWLPHVTLGYPASPAKKDERDYPGFHSISFDRIAVWTDNYEGPVEVALPWDREMDILAMMDPTARFLRHHGIKGMRWGHRKDGKPGSSNGPLSRYKAKVKEHNAPKAPPSEEALRVKAHKKKVKKSGVESLSNKELKELVDRLNLEQNLDRLAGTSAKSGSDLAKDMLKDIGKKKLTELASDPKNWEKVINATRK